VAGVATGVVVLSNAAFLQYLVEHDISVVWLVLVAEAETKR
jgi:hypothetical protein